MEADGSNPPVLKFPPLTKCQETKNYADPEVLCHTFETLSNLHKLLPNHLMKWLSSYRSKEDKKINENSELSSLEKMLERHDLPKEISLTPKPNRMPPWKRKTINNVSDGWKKCPLWRRTTKEPPMSTVVVRWVKKNMEPSEDLESVTRRLSAFGPIQSVAVCGRQTAIVVFKDITSACHAVSAFHSKERGAALQCSWQQQFMAKDQAYSRKCSKKTQSKENRKETGKKHRP
ncbi:uncharacterized protein C6orf201 homolog isoform X2 [Tupaia chinensis]|uniref:uncharacterized protein C6orf201 homolog isoform X2 n=1 Tax=Tupaia chinensis TaxID=246437 RepID=UPI0003C8DABD|nr:uncharacterized protein C6orf201 homolog isoform X2 [Tupaia chinensis]